MNIFVIGTGNVAFSLVPALKNAGHAIGNVSSRGEIFIPPETDICIICTADSAIETVASKLKTSAVVLHTSGSTDVSVLKKYFKNCGVIYPVQTFTKGKLVDFKNVPLLIEGEDKKIEALAESLSSDVRKMTSCQRKFLHLAAVFACNFTNNMLVSAKYLTESNGVDFSLLQPIITETVNKAQTLGAEFSQSGPAVRDDLPILNLHLNLLENEPVLKKIYSFVSENIKDFKTKFTNGIPRKTEKN